MTETCTIKCNPASIFLGFMDGLGTIEIEYRGPVPKEPKMTARVIVTATHRKRRRDWWSRESRFIYYTGTGTLRRFDRKSGLWLEIYCSPASIDRFLRWTHQRAGAALPSELHGPYVRGILGMVMRFCCGDK